MKKDENLMKLSQTELIDSALLKLVSGAGDECDWRDSCGCTDMDWCGVWEISN